MSRSGALIRVLVLSTIASCASNPSPGGTGTAGATGTAGTSPGTAGTSGSAGDTSGAGSAGTAGSAGSAGAGEGGQVGGAGSGGSAAGTTGSGGTAGTGSAGASAGVTGTDAGAGAGGTTTSDGSVTGVAGSHGNKILLYTKSTGFVHSSTPIAAAQITKAAAAFGLVAETSADTAKFTPEALSQYAVVVLIATAGEPLGSPGTAEITALVDWVHGGGGLVAIENADHAYDDVAAYVNLIGGDFNGHAAGVDTCVVDGTHPTTMHLPATFMVNDEIYYTLKFRMDNQVVLRCGADKRPIAWVRQEGGGRVFYEALGHNDVQWTTPPLVDGLVLPGILWSMGRAVP